MSTITLNGERREIEGVEPLADLLARYKLNAQYLAVAVNDSVIPRSEHGAIRIKDGDRIEVIQAVGGG